MKRALLLLVASSTLGYGCSSEATPSAYAECLKAEAASARGSGAEPSAGDVGPELVPADPGALVQAQKDAFKVSMRAQVESARVSAIAQKRCEAFRPQMGDERNAAMAPSAAADGASGGGATSVSTTNNQVAGVDEADFVKNDNKYIYVAKDSMLRIVEAWPAETAREVATVPVRGKAKKLFVTANRAVVYSAVQPDPASEPMIPRTSSYSECTYGYSGCVPAGDGTETDITVFDITNRAAPSLLRTIHSSSSLIAARRIGDAVHTVLAEGSRAPSFQTRPNGLSKDDSEAEINEAFAALETANSAAIDALQLTDILPKWSDSAGQPMPASTFRSALPDGTALTSVLSFDITSPAQPTIASVLGRPGWVYASASGLYIAVPHQRSTGYGWYVNYGEPELSTIHKFTIGVTPAATRYASTGVVKGRALNQFALDEHAGHLRVATTTGRVPSPDVHSTISILGDQSGRLERVGMIDGIAKTEDIRSVRFDGDRGYIVTFKKTDPLFVFDLSDPSAPKTQGELKIPGFSTYMHMMDPTHLLTIGYDAADQGTFAYFTGVLLQIFDVSNPNDPKLVHKEIIGTRGSSSEALTNHLAFNYFAPKNLLALPMKICEGGGTEGQYGTNMTFSGLMVYDATTAAGFTLRGKIAHPTLASTLNEWGYSNTGCSTWWTNATSEVKRSIIMDDVVFSVSEARIKANRLDSTMTELKEVLLGSAANP
jgi:hypothetical protein